MSVKSIAAAILVSSYVLTFALAEEQSIIPVGGVSDFHYDVERGMKADALERQQPYAPLNPPTFTGPELLPLTWPGLRGPERRKLSLDRSGWPFQTNGEIFSIPCYDNDYMYFGACDGTFYCVDKKTGAIRWQKDGLVRIDSSPTLHNDTVYFSAIDDTVYALNCSSGEIRWKKDVQGVGY